ncbi:AAA family ATPase [Pelagibacterium lacus]|uniref:Toprim domain-containing protein n=1 Tax=Pelagibacterium lacus TaxID=2282655 RepID=A0A369VZ90_9HYPH|nr:AAA family ATPase [Pelagibacterium lacus]RDE07716.1 hypothetical protein DVH29_15205 [Pelagibacterium lacus]
MAEHDWPAIIQPVAESFWGEPNKKLSSDKEKKWGSYGSRSINIEKACWFDHEAGEGGNVIELVQREAGLGDDNAAAMAWLEQEGYIEARERPQERRESDPAPEARQEPQPQGGPGDDGRLKWVKGYTYHNSDGDGLYQVLRGQWVLPDGSWRLAKDGQIDKTFRQRRPDGKGGYIWNLDGIGHTIYRHNKVEEAIAAGRPILLPEGEKDADTAVTLGFEASTNSGGAKNWTAELAALFKGADVIILVDNDEVGIAAGEAKAKSLKGIARRIRILNFADHVPNFPVKHDLTNWVEAGGTADELHRIIDSLPDWRPAPPVSKFAAQRGMDLAGSKIVYDWLVKGLIERGGVFIVAGEKQSGKSFFVIDLGMKIALGLGYGKGDQARKVRQGAVIYMASEDRKGVELRYEGWRRDHDVPRDQDVPFVIMGGGDGQKFSLMSDESVDAFIAECLEWEDYYGSLEMIVIDTFSVATEGLDEIHSGEVGKVLGRVNRIADKTGSTVCLVHHMNGEGSRVRGHSSLTANVSQVIEISTLRRPSPNRKMPGEEIKDADNRIIRKALLEKNKNGPNRIAWRFILRQIKLGHDDDGFEITTCVLDTPSSEPDEEQTKTGRLHPAQKLVLDCLVDAVADAGIDMPSGVRVGPQIKKAVPFNVWRAYVRKRWTFKAPENDVEQRNKELVEVMGRTGTALMNAGYMGRDNDKKIVWSLGKERKSVSAMPAAEPPPPLPEAVQRDLEHFSGMPDQVPF